jgi:cation diffusion facilitator family transporter
VLALVALLIGYEALTRVIWPVPIDFTQAIPIAALGLVVNIVSAIHLGGGDHQHGHEHGHHHAHGGHDDHHERGHGHEHVHADHAAVLADAAVSILVIAGLVAGRFFGWTWMDPAVGLVGAVVIAAWAYTLIRDTGAILLDMTPDRAMAERMRATIETDGDRLTDLHLWRLGPGHLGAIVSVATRQERGPDYYQALLGRFRTLSHVTIEVLRQ